MLVPVLYPRRPLPGQHIGIQARIPSICRLGAEEDNSRQTDATEDSNQVEGPPPIQGVGDFTHYDGREEGSTKHGQISKGHADASLVDKIQIADGDVDQGLKGRAPDALDDPGPQEAVVVLLLAHNAAPGARGDQHHDAEDEGMPLAPDAAGWHEQCAREAHAQQEITRQEGDVGEVMGHVQRDSDGVCSEDGAERGGEDG